MPDSRVPTSRPTPIPFIDLQAQRQHIGSRIDQAIGRVLEHGRFILGPEVTELERQLAAFCGVSHAVTCANGTDALQLVLMAREIGPGDAVFVPSFTFTATAEVVALIGATPVFVDIRDSDFNMDPAALEAAVVWAGREGLKPTAIIAVDLFGQPADYTALSAIAAEHKLFLLADAAQSFGAERAGRRVGAMGDAATTSFFPAKPLGCYGDGGAIFTQDENMAAVLRSLRMHGQGVDRYDNVRIGMTSRLDTVQAAILMEKLAILPDEILARQRVAQRYNDGLGDLIGTPRVEEGVRSVWAQYTITLDGRDQVAAELGAAGIPTAIYYPKPLHLQAAYRRFPAPAGLPVSERLADYVLSLPMHPYLDPDTQDRIINAVRAARPGRPSKG
ncbi:DegT/DnrJ/EryC1/StrS family aminotransferase [Rhodospirillaceae bacterium SYSU D60014]|uniref:DegT/DnrJ/EryC1/StrS family aminotransferase n=1 Tax=Virgifigura deserti TaxID=2268457 RepID=UPI000E660C3E